MNLKYATSLGAMHGCPPQDAEQRACSGFRFVFASIDNPRNFVPVAALNPRRQFRDVDECCSSWALSMFANMEQAKARYKELQKIIKKIHLTIGTHLAEGAIAATDGS